MVDSFVLFLFYPELPRIATAHPDTRNDACGIVAVTSGRTRGPPLQLQANSFYFGTFVSRTRALVGEVGTVKYSVAQL